MPAVKGAVSFAYVLRLTCTEVAENLTADHVRTARAKGLSGSRVMIVHVLRYPGSWRLPGRGPGAPYGGAYRH